mmetsp:Transcript_34672/g.53116  ORF Transcript_34672/g.53116 Transcript_34672/m.53116 type:complete len:94 (-) Transcript_34672:1194-1475(-)
MTIEATYEQTDSDGGVNAESETYPVKACGEQDFARTSKTQAIYNNILKSFKPICLSAIPEAKIKGDSSSIERATYSIYFKPCEGQGCASNNDI